MKISPAKPDDVDTILRWRRELTAWLRGQGCDQWSQPLPREAVAEAVDAGRTWMARDDDGEPAGTITVYRWNETAQIWAPDAPSPDQVLSWRPEDGPEDALYVAKTMVPRRYAGQQLGAEMVDWAGGQAWQAGLGWLRLDAWSTNGRLHAYYLGQGFTLVRIEAGRMSGACFERRTRRYDGPLKTDGG